MIWDSLKRVFRRKGVRDRVLVVEDDPVILALIRNHLKAAGVVMNYVDSCDDALALATESPKEYSLLILETKVNGESGLELARQLRMARETSRIPILFLLDRGTEEGAARLKRTFAHTWVIAKPFSGMQFTEEVKTVLRTRVRRPSAKSSMRGKSPFPPPARMRTREYD